MGNSSDPEGPAFPGISLARIRTLCPSSRVQALDHKSRVYGQGEVCDDVFCVVSGQIKLARTNRNGDEFTTAFLSTGQFFGPALAGDGENETLEAASARGAVRLWRARAEEFKRVILECPAAGWRILQQANKRRDQIESRLECFFFQRVEVRLAQTFKELSGGFEDHCEHGFGMHIRITQQELADLVGATRPVVSTILNKLRRKGVLGYSREYVCVRHIDVIEDLIVS